MWKYGGTKKIAPCVKTNQQQDAKARTRGYAHKHTPTDPQRLDLKRVCVVAAAHMTDGFIMK